MEMIQRADKAKKKKKNSIRYLWDNIKHSNLQIGILEENRGLKMYLKKLWLKISPNPKKEIDIQIQELQRVPNKKKPNRATPKHIIIKMEKVK